MFVVLIRFSFSNNTGDVLYSNFGGLISFYIIDLMVIDSVLYLFIFGSLPLTRSSLLHGHFTSTMRMFMVGNM